MRFEAREDTGNGLDTIRLRDTATGAECSVLPQFGGTVRRLILAAAPSSLARGAGRVGAGRVGAEPVGDGALAETLEEDAPHEIPQNPGFRGRILFPFNDRIPGGLYRFDGQDYQLRQNDPETGCAIHGLIYDRRCEVSALSANDTEADLTLTYNIHPDAFPGYPFSVQLTARYRLSENGFDLLLEAQNTGMMPAPVSMGWHPYILTPDGVDAARLTCPGSRYVEVDEELLPTGALPSVSGTTFDFWDAEQVGERELDIALERTRGAGGARKAARGTRGEEAARGAGRTRGEGAARAAGEPAGTATTLVDRGHDTVALRQSTDPFRFTQLFTSPSRASIAVEPITGATNAFNNPELGLMRLEGGEQLSGEVSTTLLINPR